MPVNMTRNLPQGCQSPPGDLGAGHARTSATAAHGSGGREASFTPRSVVKDGTLWSYINLVRPLPRRYLRWRKRQRVIVLLYHRVNEELRDAVTVSPRQFDEQMAWLSRHCPVVDIIDVVRGRVPRGTNRPVVAVTFDDGYLDNYENAVPILLRHGIPAAFFVSTGMINTNNGFAHDLDKLGYALPNMTWEQLRRMKDLEFTIGSHTVTHLNCAKSDIDAVRRELVESRDTLREELALDEIVFASPFGGQTDISQQALDLVKDVGYIGCLSAYGGHIAGDIDPYDVPRMAISYNFSMLAFRARLEGLG